MGFVQARMGSSRLPGKVLAPLAGEPLLARVLARVERTPGLGGVALLTTEEPADAPLRSLGARLGVPVVAGSHEDVLDRFRLAAERLGVETIVRVTADCPLVDPELLGELLQAWTQAAPTAPTAYAAIATGAMRARPGLCRYPDGLDGEVFSRAGLEQAWRESRDPYEREHVTPFIWRRPERFPAILLQPEEDLGDERWTVDHASDLDFLRAVYERLGGLADFGYRDVLALLAREPGLRELNSTAREHAQPVR